MTEVKIWSAKSPLAKRHRRRRRCHCQRSNNANIFYVWVYDTTFNIFGFCCCILYFFVCVLKIYESTATTLSTVWCTWLLVLPAFWLAFDRFHQHHYRIYESNILTKSSRATSTSNGWNIRSVDTQTQLYNTLVRTHINICVLHSGYWVWAVSAWGGTSHRNSLTFRFRWEVSHSTHTHFAAENAKHQVAISKWFRIELNLLLLLAFCAPRF